MDLRTHLADLKRGHLIFNSLSDAGILKMFEHLVNIIAPKEESETTDGNESDGGQSDASEEQSVRGVESETGGQTESNATEGSVQADSGRFGFLETGEPAAVSGDGAGQSGGNGITIDLHRWEHEGGQVGEG